MSLMLESKYNAQLHTHMKRKLPKEKQIRSNQPVVIKHRTVHSYLKMVQSPLKNAFIYDEKPQLNPTVSAATVDYE